MSATVVEPGAARRWPRRRIWVTVLTVSVALNLFFIAGALWTRMHVSRWPTPQERYEQVAAELALTPQQRPGFDRYVTAMRGRAERMRQQTRPLIASTWDEMTKPDADAGKITARFDEASQKWLQFQHEMTAETLNFLSLLSPQQRAKFVQIARERRAPWLRPRGEKQR